MYLKAALIGHILLLTSCDAGSLSKQSPVDENKLIAIDGYQQLKFGMSFYGALAATRVDLFYPGSLKECQRNMATEGCLLFQKSNDSVFEMREGIPYALQLHFSKYDKLDQIGLVFARGKQEEDISEEGISKAECQDVFLRSVDWLSEEYGKLEQRAKSDENDGSYKNVKTRNGIALHIGSAGDGSLIELGEIKLARGARIYIMLAALDMDDHIDCRISIDFDGSTPAKSVSSKG